MKSCNIRYIFQHTYIKTLKEIQNRNKEVKRISSLKNSEASLCLCNNVSENIIDIFSGEPYEKKLLASSI